MSALVGKMTQQNLLKKEKIQNLRPFGKLITTTPLFTESSNDEKIHEILDQCEPEHAATLIESIMLAAYVAGTNRETFAYMSDAKIGVGEAIRKRTLDAHTVVCEYFAKHNCNDWSYASIIRCVGRTAWVTALENLSNTKVGALIQNLPIFWIVLTEEDFQTMLKSYIDILKLPPVWGYLRSLDAWDNKVECERWRYIAALFPKTVPQDQTGAVAYRRIIRKAIRSEEITEEELAACKQRYGEIIAKREKYGSSADQVWVKGISLVKY